MIAEIIIASTLFINSHIPLTCSNISWFLKLEENFIKQMISVKDEAEIRNQLSMMQDVDKLIKVHQDLTKLMFEKRKELCSGEPQKDS